MSNLLSFRIWPEVEEHLNKSVVEYNECSDGKWSRTDIINLSIEYFYRLTYRHTSSKDLTAMLSIIYSGIEKNLDTLELEDLMCLNQFLMKKIKEKDLVIRREKINQGL